MKNDDFADQFWDSSAPLAIQSRNGNAQSIAAQRWQLERALVWNWANWAASDFGRSQFANITLVH